MLAALDQDSGTLTMFCSATLVADQAVVTAGHCEDAAQTYEDWGRPTYFLVGDSIDDLQDAVLVDGWTVHPDFVFSDTDLAADVAVGSLERSLDLDLDLDVQPLRLRTADLGTGWYDQDLTLVGFGSTQDGDQDVGIRRTTTVPVYTLDSDFAYGLDLDPLGGNACSGDSGGAALRQTDGVWELVGVLSFVFAWQSDTTSCVGGGVGATRMDVFGGWAAQEAGLDVGGDQPGSGGGLGGAVGGSDAGGENPFVDPPGQGCCATSAPPSALWGLGRGGVVLLLRRQGGPSGTLNSPG